MSKLVFYRQERIDGGIRTGISLNENTIYSRFDPGSDDPDPALLWFVDLRCTGETLPDSANAARKWLLVHQQVIKNGFTRCSEDLRAGIDLDHMPWSWINFTNGPMGVEMKIVLSAIRRVDGIEMSNILREIGSHWEELVRGLKPIHPAWHRQG